VPLFRGKMSNPLHGLLRTSSLVLLAGFFVIALVIAYRDGAKRAELARKTQKVLVTFEGPWAFARDPNDANSVFAFAPKTSSHRDLVVQVSREQDESMAGKGETLGAGIYELLLPAIPSSAPNIDPNVLQAKIDAQGVQHALSAKSERYAIRLPRPEAYVASSNERSRAGSAYPPAASTEKDYVTIVSLRYSVDKLSGVSLAGKPDDDSPFNRLPVESRVISFVIQPLPGQMMDECSMHVREAFRDLAKLVNLKMFVDFPNDPSACREHDPQKPPA
jgi:hypothetical protein